MNTNANAASVSPLSLNEVLVLARKHLGKGDMVSSARLCMSDAIALSGKGDSANARCRAVKSLAYSVGIFHEDYQAASR